MDAPQNNIWGPEMWKIIHGLAEKIGTYPTVSHRRETNTQINEEKRLWGILLSSLRLSLPCPLCRKHYSEFIGSNPIHNIVNLNPGIVGGLSKEQVKSWLYHLHSSVNNRNNKENISIEILSDLYRHINYNYSLNIIAIHMKRGINKHWITHEDMMRTIRVLKEMFAFYCC